MIIITPANSIYNSIKWRKTDGARLDKLLTGCTITGAELIDYPFTDGVIIYMKNEKGRALALQIESDPDELDSFLITTGHYNTEAAGAAKRGAAKK